MGLLTTEPAIDKRSRRWTVAVHESAHAVVAEELGWSVRSVRIIKDGDEGIMSDAPPWLRDRTRRATENAVIALAGVCASLRETDGAEPYGLEHDRADAVRALRGVEVSYPEAEMRARELVNGHWGRIQRTAERLYRLGRI